MGFFLGVKGPGHGIDLPNPSSAKVKERIELHIFSPFWGFVDHFRVNINFTSCSFTVWSVVYVLVASSCGPGSSVGIATGYGLDGPGISSRWGVTFFRTCPDLPWGPPSLLYNGYRVFPRGKERPGRNADPSLASSAVVMKG